VDETGRNMPSVPVHGTVILDETLHFLLYTGDIFIPSIGMFFQYEYDFGAYPSLSRKNVKRKQK
jgi:hypothetical protein